MKLFVTVVLFAVALSPGRANPPTIFEVLDPVRPDETLLLFGADVTPQATVEGLRLADDPVSAPPTKLAMAPSGQPAKLEMLQATDLSAKVLIPRSWKPGIYAVRVRNADGPGSWQFANRPQLWWQMSGVGGKANPGGELRVFGKNLGPKSRLWLVDDAGKSRELKTTVARDYDVTATLPASLPTGSYGIWLHNGHGGEAGFGEPLALEVAPADTWPTTVYRVTDFGAKGNGDVDDTLALRRTLEKAGAEGGGVVYLPRGTYLVTGKLVMPPRTVLRGEGRDEVSIKVPFRIPPPLSGELPIFDAVIAGNGNFGVESLSIVAQPVRRIIAAPDIPDAFAPTLAGWNSKTPHADHVVLRNLLIQHLYFAHGKLDADTGGRLNAGPSTIAVNGADFTLADSEVISAGMPIQIANASRARISGNRLRTGKGWYGLFNFSDGVFEGNDIGAGDLIGGYGGVQGNAFHVLFRKNHWHDGFGGDREALTFDTPYFPVWMGRVSVWGWKLTLGTCESGTWPPSPDYPPALLAVVAGGRGLGQAVPVQSISEKTVTLERPFAIPPDAKSLVVISGRKDQVLVVDNAFDDASVAIQLYAQSREFLIAGNQSRRTGGCYAHAFDYLDPTSSRHRYSYVIFNQWLVNTFTEGFVYDQGPWPYGYVGYDSSRTASLKESTPAIGNRLAGNRLLGGSRFGATVPQRRTLPPGSVPFGRDGIFEQNFVCRQPVGITVDSGHADTLLRGNHFEAVTQPVVNAGSHTLVLP